MSVHRAVEAAAVHLPHRWRIAPFGRLATERGVRNSTLSEAALSLSSSGALYLRTEETDRQFGSEQSARNGWVVRPGDLVVNPMWLFGGAIGVSRLDGAVSPDYRVYALSPALHPPFVHHLLRSRPYRDQYRLYMRAETTFDRRITKDDFAEMPILVPPPSEQVAIARYLDGEDERIGMVLEARRRQSDLLSERLTSAVRSLILDAPGALRPISALADYVNGRPFKPGDFTISGLPVVRIRQLVDPLAESDYFDGAVQPRHLLADGDLVFSWSASLESRIWNRGPAILNQHLFKVLPRPGVDRHWLRWALHVAREDFLELMHGSTMIHITQPMMKEVRVPLPSHTEQLHIAEMANQLSATAAGFLDSVGRQVAALQERRQALITAAVTGQIEIPGVAA